MKKQILIKLGQRIRELRKAKSLSQEEIAGRTDLHRTYIRGVERGERNISMLNIARLAKALEVSLSELLYGIE